MSSIENRCCKTLSGGLGGGFYLRKCTRQATVTRDGRHYCGQHDPVKVAERRDRADAEYRKKLDAERAAHAKLAENARRAEAYPEMVEFMKGLVEALRYNPSPLLRDYRNRAKALLIKIEEIK